MPFQVEEHRKPQGIDTDVAKLKLASNRLYAAHRSAVRRDIDDRYHDLLKTSTSNLVDRPEVSP